MSGFWSGQYIVARSFGIEFNSLNIEYPEIFCVTNKLLYASKLLLQITTFKPTLTKSTTSKRTYLVFT